MLQIVVVCVNKQKQYVVTVKTIAHGTYKTKGTYVRILQSNLILEKLYANLLDSTGTSHLSSSPPASLECSTPGQLQRRHEPAPEGSL